MIKDSAFMIFKNTLHKEYRNKALITLLIFTTAAIISVSLFLNYLNEEVLLQVGSDIVGNKALKGFFYFVSIWSIFLSIYFGINSVKSDISSGVIGQILSFPIKRIEYLVSRILGSWAIVTAYYIYTIALAILCISLSSGNLIISKGIFFSLIFTSISCLGTIILSILFSLFFNNIISFIGMCTISFLMTISSSYFTGIATFSEKISELSLTKGLGLILHYVLPRNYSMSQLSNAALVGEDAGLSLGIELGHYFLTSLILLALTAFIFRRRNL